jgi:hypothetical protein
VKVGVEAVEGVVSLPGPALQLLPPTSKARRAGVRKKHERRKSGRRNYETPRNPANLEDMPRRTAVDLQRLVQRPVERGVVVTELLPMPLLRLGLDEVGQWRAGIPLLRMCRESSARRGSLGAVR